MSTGLKRSLYDAVEDAKALRALFPAGCWRQWEFAGSVRRNRDEVSDVEHVVESTMGDVAGGGLFPVTVNLLWHHLDELERGGQVRKHVYGTTDTGAPLHRWGEKYRGIEFRGYTHEFFSADPDNWGPTLAIRTGPAEFSQSLVVGLRRQGRRNIRGYAWQCRRCPHCERGNGECKACDGTGLDPVERMSVGDEREYFRLAGMAWREPEERR